MTELGAALLILCAFGVAVSSALLVFWFGGRMARAHEQAQREARKIARRERHDAELAETSPTHNEPPLDERKPR